MRRIAIIVVGLCLLGGLGLSALRNAGDRVYSVPALRAAVAADPAVLVGHTVLVRGAIMDGWCPATASCIFGRQSLVDASQNLARGWLPVAIGRASGLLALLRRAPWLSRIVPGPKQVQWNVTRVYRVELRVASGYTCGTSPCYDALLPDAALPTGAGRHGVWSRIVPLSRATARPIVTMPIAVP
jgi:hypothetical protein